MHKANALCYRGHSGVFYPVHKNKNISNTKYARKHSIKPLQTHNLSVSTQRALLHFIGRKNLHSGVIKDNYSI